MFGVFSAPWITSEKAWYIRIKQLTVPFKDIEALKAVSVTIRVKEVAPKTKQFPGYINRLIHKKP